MYSDVKQLFSSSSCEIQNYEETKQISREKKGLNGPVL